MSHGAACSASLETRSLDIDSVDDASHDQRRLTAVRRFAATAEWSPEFDEALAVVRNNRLVETVLKVHLESATPLATGSSTPPTRPIYDETKLRRKIAAIVDDDKAFAAEIAKLLNLGSENQLAEQIALLSTNEEQVEDETETDETPGCLESLCFEQQQSVAEAFPLHGATTTHDATKLLEEAACAHDRVLQLLFERASELGTSAWRQHQAQLVHYEALHTSCNQIAALKEHALSELQREIQDLEKRIEAARRATGIQAAAEDSRDHTTLRQCRTEGARVRSDMLRLLERAAHAKNELDAERDRGEWLAANATHVATVRAAHVNERERQSRALIELQQSVYAVCREIIRAGNELQSGDATSALEVQAASRIAIVRLRERIREEGRRRRWLREEELAFFRSDMRRLAEDAAAHNERTALLGMLIQAHDERDEVSAC